MKTLAQKRATRRLGQAFWRLGRETAPAAAPASQGVKLLSTIDRIDFEDMNGNVIGTQSRTQNDPPPARVHYTVIHYVDGRSQRALRG